MGNTVSLSPLILTISNEEQSHSDQGPDIKIPDIQAVAL